jgi:NitT/TauT family transport system ATP-binding protein
MDFNGSCPYFIPASPRMSKILLEDVTFTYVDQNTYHTAVQNVNIAINKGEFVSVIGPSGCGKSTLLSMLAGLNFPSKGYVLLDGKQIEGTGTDRGIVFQHYSLFPWMSARKNIIFGVEQVCNGQSKREIEKIADDFLNLVGLEAFADKYPSQLSGGMQQRVAIARAFAMNPQMLLLDEPFGALDARNRLILQDVLLKLWDSGAEKKTVFLVTHDIDEAILLSDRIIVMSGKPGTVKQDFVVRFKRPRERSSLVKCAEYIELRNKLVSLFYDDLLEKIGGPEVLL